MSKPINMATGGLMSLPPYLKDTKKEDKGITPYDVNTPESARKGLPQRGLSKSRTRYSKGDLAKKNGEIEVWDADDWEYMNSKKKQIKNKKIKKVALGGYMDNFQISQEEPLAKFSIGGAAALDEKYDRRKDYRAYAEGDEVIAEEEIVEEPLMAPVGMEEGPMPLIEDEIAADDIAMKKI